MLPQRNEQNTAPNSRQTRRRLAKQARKQKGVQTARAKNIGAMVQVAEGLRLAGRYDEAENMWRQMRQDFPDQAQPYIGLGIMMSLRARHGEAYSLYKKAVTIAPGEFLAWRHFGLCLYQLRQYEASAIAFKKAIALQPNRADSYYDLACTLYHDEQADEALAAYGKAIELKPDFAEAHLGKGIQLQTLGRFEEAKECFYRAIELNPENTVAHFRLASMDQSVEEGDRLLARLTKLSQSSKLHNAEKAAAWFSSGDILHRRKEHDRAFEHYAAGNGLLKQENTFNRSAFTTHVDDKIAGFTPEVFEIHRDAGSPSRSPIFIVGMPRSGTTLVEAIISSHPDVAGGGEQRKMAEIADALINTEGALNYPRDLADINPAHLLPFGTQYLSHMARLFPGAKKTTDKLPFNCLHLGLIAILFPNVSIIHCRRDPIDTCLSCYFQYFGESQVLSFTHDLEDLGFVYSEYERLMDHWHAVLPIRIFDVQYEELIASQEEVSRQMIDHVGLEWHEACLSFHQQERTITTASHTQVRQPIYRSSVEKWRKYESHLKPLQQALKQAS